MQMSYWVKGAGGGGVGGGLDEKKNLKILDLQRVTLASLKTAVSNFEYYQVYFCFGKN